MRKQKEVRPTRLTPALKQQAYRERREVLSGLLAELWLLRRQREKGNVPVPLPSHGRVELLAQLVRQLIHEERLLASVSVVARPPQADVSDQGLSTDHTATTTLPKEVVTKKKQSNGTKKPRHKK